MQSTPLMQAQAIAQGLSFAAGKQRPIASITVQYPDGDRKLCQYPDSFCEFKQIDNDWQYSQCTCQMELPSEPLNIWQADQIFPFPDFYNRPVHFARYGRKTALFVSNICQGFLIEEPSCLCLHHHETGL